MRRLLVLGAVLFAVATSCLTASAAANSPFQFAEEIRVALLNAQLNIAREPAQAQKDVTQARDAYAGTFAKTLKQAAPQADTRVRAGLDDAVRATEAGDAIALADARAQVWTGLLQG